MIDSLCVTIQEAYIFEDVAEKMVKHLRQREKKGAYSKAANLAELAELFTADVREISHDKHLGMRAGPPVDPSRDFEAEGMERIRQRREAFRQNNWGFKSIEILDGNVGYLDLRGFAPIEDGGATAEAAMGFLANADALIFDLRQNGGGNPSMIQFLTSYLFEEPTHLNSFYHRQVDEMSQFWTQGFVPGRKMVDTPVYVLTSNYTFSAAEEFSYNLRNLERATIVGETTGGGAHPVDQFLFDFGSFTLSTQIPTGRAINPITGTNWEGVGVKPHIEVPADQALEAALADFEASRAAGMEAVPAGASQ
jgi:C-terminal processing protease CtpA/Prc